LWYTHGYNVYKETGDDIYTLASFLRTSVEQLDKYVGAQYIGFYGSCNLKGWADANPENVMAINMRDQSQSIQRSGGVNFIMPTPSYNNPVSPPKELKVSITLSEIVRGFDKNNISYAYYLNAQYRVTYFNENVRFGHAAIMLIDSNGRGLFASFGPFNDSTSGAQRILGVDGEILIKFLSNSDVGDFLNTGDIFNAYGFNSANKNVNTKRWDGKYNRYVNIYVTKHEGSRMYNKLMNYVNNVPTFYATAFNCNTVATTILSSGILELFRYFTDYGVGFPNTTYNNLANIYPTGKIAA